MFRAALFEQLGEPRLEGAITTDIAAKRFARYPPRQRSSGIDQRARLNRKQRRQSFRSNGTNRVEATVPEIRLALPRPIFGYWKC